MKKINIYNPRIPYFIMYRKGGWVFYNREYRNLLTGEPESTDDPKKIYNIPVSVLSKLSPDFNTATPPKEYHRVYLHDNPNMVGKEKRKYISRIIALLRNGIDPLNLLSSQVIYACLINNWEELDKELEYILVEISN